ncbi:hypothetical protein GOQ27_05125 [Clostridium sp. D2Q-11]|uniref:Uncharacterized protein n=1 Tax=Anaeromonas frigoriresistens TaxID=2683708 RepID=A0A942Z6Q5_9FIRM|nr:hypothetical protein [Anaeromonas frigoriresistens]MBS4537832.1 hypothetical protein [Anaeromonas frigoriresistens]
MRIRPHIVIADLEWYLKLYDIALSEETRRTLLEVEEFAYKCDNPSSYNIFFSKIMRNSKSIRNILIEEGANPNFIALMLERDYYEDIDHLSKYEKEAYSYSEIGIRKNNDKTVVIDRALEYCIKDNRKLIEITDVFLAAIDNYERILEEADAHSGWTDKRMNSQYAMFSHVCGCYKEELLVKFDDIRNAILKIRKQNKSIKIA